MEDESIHFRQSLIKEIIYLNLEKSELHCLQSSSRVGNCIFHMSPLSECSIFHTCQTFANTLAKRFVPKSFLNSQINISILSKFEILIWKRTNEKGIHVRLTTFLKGSHRLMLKNKILSWDEKPETKIYQRLFDTQRTIFIIYLDRRSPAYFVNKKNFRAL